MPPKKKFRPLISIMSNEKYKGSKSDLNNAEILDFPSLALQQTETPEITGSSITRRQRTQRNRPSQLGNDAVQSKATHVNYDKHYEEDPYITLSANVDVNNDLHQDQTTGEVSPESYPTNKRRGRGATTWKAVKPTSDNMWQCIVVNGVPVGEGAIKLSTTLGLYARVGSLFPLHKEWRQHAQHRFNDVMDDIKKNYNFIWKEGEEKDMSLIFKWCKETIQGRIRDWRHELKQKYYKGDGSEELDILPDSRVTPSEWKSLLDYWEHEKKKIEATKNKVNRAENRTVHALGSTTIASHKHKLREAMGENYSELDAHVKIYQKRNGEYLDEYTKFKCEEVIEKCDHYNIIASSEPYVLRPILDEVFHGHHGGYERGEGRNGRSRAAIRVLNSPAAEETLLELRTSKETISLLQTELDTSNRRLEIVEAREKQTVEKLAMLESMLNQLSQTVVGALPRNMRVTTTPPNLHLHKDN